MAGPSFGVGDEVVIKIRDMDLIKQMQVDHGGWNDAMKECLVGPCKLIHYDAVVKAPSGQVYRLNSELLSKYNKPNESILLMSDTSVLLAAMDGDKTLQELRGLVGQPVELVQKGHDGKCTVKHQSKEYILHENCFVISDEASKSSSSTINDEESRSRYSVGDIAKVIEDENKVKALQEGHVEWNNLMTLILKKKGFEKYIHPNGDREVEINDIKTRLNQDCVMGVKWKPSIFEEMEKMWKLKTSLKLNDETENYSADTPLHVAVWDKNYDLCCKLVEEGDDVNMLNEIYMTPIMLALYIGYEKVLPLLAKHSKLDIGDLNNDTPLHVAVQNSNVNAVRILLEAGADIKATNNQQFTPFHLAARQGNEKILELCLDKHGESLVDLQKEDKFTALHLAALNNHTTCLQLLIGRKADLNIRTNMMQTALHIAVSQKYMDCVKILVESKAEINVQDEDGETPLHDAINLHNICKMKEKMKGMIGFEGIFKLMKGLQKDGDKPEDIAIYLVKHGASLDIVNNAGNSPLTECVDQSLLEKLCNLQDKTGTDRPMASLVAEPETQEERIEHLQLTIHNLQNEILCVICRERRTNVAFNCGHRACDVCAQNINDCFMCHQRIMTRIQIR